MWDVSSLYDCADLTKYDFSDNLGKYILSSVGPKRHIEGVLAIDDKCIIPESLPINIDDFFNNAKSSNKWLEPHLLIILIPNTFPIFVCVGLMSLGSFYFSLSNFWYVNFFNWGCRRQWVV